MGSLQDDSSDQYYSGAARRLNGNLVVYRHRQAPNATATYQHGAGANQFQSKSTSSTLYASGGRAEPWQQLLPPPQQQQQQQVRAAGSEQPAVITRQGGGQPQPLTSTRRDYVGSQPWSVSNGQTATHTRNISRPQTPAGSEYGEDRYVNFQLC
jgi:hypothetical protein